MDLIFARDLFKKYRWSAALIVGAFLLAGLVLPSLMQPRYKVTSVLSISPSYFQNSLLREFLSEVYEGSELRSLRQSLISQALDQNALDDISRKAGLLPANEEPLEAASRRQALLKSIEVFPLQSSDFQISVVSNSRERGLLINQEVLANVERVLRTKRQRGLEKLRAAIGVQLDSMRPNSATAGALNSKISQLEQDLATKRLSFSPKHPAIREKEKELQHLKRVYLAGKAQQSTLSASSENATLETQVAAGEAKAYAALPQSPENTVYNDLSRKYSYLNIVILAEAGPNPSYFSIVRSPELPTAPIWPRRSLFLVWASLLGLFTAAIYIALKEFIFDVQKKNPVVRGNLRNHDFVDANNTTVNAPKSARTERPHFNGTQL